ncbi:MAG: hypothetical protein Devi2KO_40070 [Devosia indica]
MGKNESDHCCGWKSGIWIKKNGGGRKHFEEENMYVRIFLEDVKKTSS